MLDAILPSMVASAEVFDDLPEAVLFPDEEAALGKVADVRRRQFVAGRVCARRALGGLGLPPTPILPGPGRAPQWPLEVVGSITHCAGYCAAAVARSRDVASIGIDAEEDGALPEGLLDLIAGAEERARLVDLARTASRVPWDRMLFSAKESVYKAWFPLTGRWLDFEDAVVTLYPVANRFRARLLVPGPVVAGRRLTELGGRWLCHRGLLLTAVVVPAGGR